MSCEKTSNDTGLHLHFRTLSATVSTQLNDDGSNTEIETKQCTIMPADKNVIHVVEISRLTNRYQGRLVKVRASILAGTLVVHAKFDVPNVGNGQLNWQDQATIPKKFQDVTFEHHVRGTENIHVEVEAEDPWVKGLFQRVDLGDLDFDITLG